MDYALRAKSVHWVGRPALSREGCIRLTADRLSREMWQRSTGQTVCWAGVANRPLPGGTLPLLGAFAVLQADIVNRRLFLVDKSIR
ncbi:hypothetical protein HAV15_010573 [Penicillium sp. str. |nr:hypothetical protein HAV15_010573 [Penicillium sp. str. \